MLNEQATMYSYTLSRTGTKLSVYCAGSVKGHCVWPNDMQVGVPARGQGGMYRNCKLNWIRSYLRIDYTGHVYILTNVERRCEWDINAANPKEVNA